MGLQGFFFSALYHAPGVTPAAGLRKGEQGSGLCFAVTWWWEQVLF